MTRCTCILCCCFVSGFFWLVSVSAPSLPETFPAVLSPAQGHVSSKTKLVNPPIEIGRTSVRQTEEPSVHTPDAHGHDPLAADSAWFREFKRDVSYDPADPHSDQMLDRLRKASGTIRAEWSGPWTPANWNWYTIPFQVVRGDSALLTVPGVWSYNPASAGPYLLPEEPVVYENRSQATYATAKWTDGNDHHLCAYVRDEASGGYKELWEYYQPWITRQGSKITAVGGASWRRFDLLHGEVPAPGVPSTDAAGLMIAPLLVRYDEVAAGFIPHALRFCVNNADISPTFKWPARTAASAWNPETGMPYGTRLRIKASWWKDHADTVLGIRTHARVIGEAMRRYGLVLADGSSGSTIQVQGAADMRWEKNVIDCLDAIPVTALEVVLTPPLLQITGPTHLKVGEEGTWALTLLPKTSPVGAGSNVSIFDQNQKMVHYAWATITDADRSVTVHERFPQPGIYTVRPYEAWNAGFGPYRITVGADAVSTTSSLPAAQR